MESKTIRWADLSGWLKIAVVGGWATIIVYGMAFIVGLITAFLETE